MWQAGAAVTEGRALLLINRNCRRGAVDLSPVRAALEAAGLELVEREPETAVEMGELIGAYREEVDRVVIAGGDGSLSAAAEPLLQSGLPLGVLPLGTANDLARTLGLPLDPEQAARVIAAGRTRNIDLGRVNGHCFFNAAHIGLGVAVTDRLSREVKGRWGVLSYGRSVFDAFRASRPFRAEIICDGQRNRLETIQLGIGNGRFYGGGMLIAEDAAIDDRQLDIYSLSAQSIWRLAKLVPALRGGVHQRRGVWSARAAQIEVHTRRPRSVVADGELITRTPARFEVVPEALAVYVPEASPDAAPGSPGKEG